MITGDRRPLTFGLAAVLLWSLLCTVAQGRTLAEWSQLCDSCHGQDGNSQVERTPSLAGQPAFFILNQLFLMREGVRKVEAMASLVKELKDGELSALAEHFSKLPAKPSGEAIDPALVKKGAEIADHRRCRFCHLPSLAGQDQMPRLAKQRVDYLMQALKEFRDTTRSGGDTAMSANLAGASDADLVALAHYCAAH